MASIEVKVSNMAGNHVCTLQVLADVTVAEVHAQIHATGGPRPRWQRLLVQDSTNELSQPRQPLFAACGLEQPPPAGTVLELTMVMTEPHDSNVLLKSLGARIEGSMASSGDSKPLLQHDLVFPPATFGSELLTGEVAASDCESAGIPSECVLGAALHEQFRRVQPEWAGDCEVSTFLDGPAITAVLPGQGCKLQAAGFSYSTWDRNYGRSCTVRGISEDGVSVELGTVDIPHNKERGDPNRENVGSLFVVLPSKHFETIFQKIVYDFGRSGHGRRLYFLYALGALS